jgi:hypothetical protein
MGGAHVRLSRRVLDDPARQTRGRQDVQPVRLRYLCVKLAHHVEVHLGMTADRQESALFDAVLVHHEMRVHMVGVLVRGRHVAPDIAEVARP